MSNKVTTFRVHWSVTSDYKTIDSYTEVVTIEGPREAEARVRSLLMQNYPGYSVIIKKSKKAKNVD